MIRPTHRVGVEIETLAPRGRSRRDLADAIARAHGGRVRRFFHPQSEPSAVPGTPVMENLTIGFAVEDAGGRLICKLVDDVTLQDDLAKGAPPRPGWWRLVSDDPRLLRLLARHGDAERDLPDVLDPLASLFGTRPEAASGMWRVADLAGASVAIGAPLPGERDRPCEIVTAPLDRDHRERLDALLGPARALGFAIPAEGAVHLHFDARPYTSARAVAGIVAWWEALGPALKAHVRTNPRCRRLGPAPPALVELVRDPAFLALDWPEARARLVGLQLAKWVDVNLRNLVTANPDKHTVEIRVLPVSLDADEILRWIALFGLFLDGAAAGGPPPDVDALVARARL